MKINATDTNSTETTRQTPTADGKAFGMYLRDLRKNMGINQAELAERAEITTGYYGFFEQGRQIPSLKVLNRLAAALDADYLEMAKRAGYDEMVARKKEIPSKGKLPEGTLQIQGVDPDESNGVDRQYSGDDASFTGDLAVARVDQNTEALHPIVIPPVAMSQERLNWAMMCIAHDPTYKLSDQFKGELPSNIKALVVQLYQAQTGRQLLTAGESLALGQMVHG